MKEKAIVQGFSSDLEGRNRKGLVWYLVFLASTIVGILALIALMLNIINGAFDYVAYEAKVDPDAAHEPRFRACAVAATCREPGFHTIFEEASPTFKQPFMYISGYTDEAAFDEFRRTLTWEGHAEKIRVPYLCLAGEHDELSPPVHTERMLSLLQCPKRLVLYQDCRHSVGNVPATHLGPTPPGLAADWMQARLAGKPFVSERWFVESSGRVVKTPY